MAVLHAVFNEETLLATSLMYLVPMLTRYAGTASPVPCRVFFFCEFIIKVWALKAHCGVRCVVTFVSRGLYTWTALHFFFNSFRRVGLLIRYLHDRTPLPLFCSVLSYLF